MANTLNPEQKQAVEYLEGPLLVLAGPGTGKTQLLSAKVAYILEHTDDNPSNILCLTFTEAGAENMRDRLQTMIGKGASQVNIYTYHAFGKTLLDRYQAYSDAPERNFESAIDETTSYKILSDIQKSLPATDILRTARICDISSTISEAKSARLTPDDLKLIAQQNLADGTEIAHATSDILLNAPKGARYPAAVEQVYEPLLEALIPYTSQDPIVKSVERIANPLARELKQILDATASADKPTTKELREWKDRTFEKNDDGTFRLKDKIANKKLLSFANIMAKYDEYLEAHGLYDFSDMIESAIRFLKTDTGFRLTLSEQFRYILLDEFQDTNTSQFELIKLLTDYEKPVVMAVGDDDQAIYAFQGANASNLMDFREHYDAKVITLVKNYRSMGEVLSLSRNIADQIGDSFVKSYSEISKVLTPMRGLRLPATLLKNQPEAPAPQNPEETTTNPELTLDQICLSRHEFPCSEAEYYWVAHEIRHLLDSGEKATDIAILSPEHKHLVAILPYLKDQNIDITYEKRENLLEDDKIQMLLTLARFLHLLAKGEQPSYLLPQILSYEFWEIHPREVFELFTDRYTTKPTLKLLSASDTFTPLADLFAALASASLSTPLELWLDYLVGNAEIDGQTSPFLSFYKSHLTPAELLEFYENLATLRQTILNHSSSLCQNLETPHLSDLIATLDDYEAAGTGITRTSNYRDATDAVQVMTAHKSKGLEFKHVFLISVDNSAWGTGSGNNNMMSLPKNLVAIRHTGNTDDEKLRLLFVAMTRAKDRLVMTNSVKNSSGKRLGRLDYLNESSVEVADPLSPYLPAPLQTIHIHRDELTDDQKITALRLNWLSHYQTYTSELSSLLASRVENYRLSPSDLTAFIDIIYAGPQSLYSKLILHEPQAPATVQQVYGTLIHEVFEQITSSNAANNIAANTSPTPDSTSTSSIPDSPSIATDDRTTPSTSSAPITPLDDAAALELFKSRVPHTNLSPEDQAYLLDFGTHNLEIALKAFGPILRHPHAKPELNFASEHLELDGTPITGKLDLITIDPDQKTIEIYDYKTSSSHATKWGSNPSLYKYRLQLGFYKLLLNLSPTYRDYKVTTGHILFVTPDNENLVHDLPYTYNADDEAELKNLIHAVHHQITSLEFANNPEIFIPADKSNTMPNIRAFVEKLLNPSD